MLDSAGIQRALLLSVAYMYGSPARTVEDRQVGVDRIPYGSDAAAGGNLPPREAWAAFRRLPLTAAEFDTIARNVAPYFR